mmetsp:Transcript_7452/g.11773  ORF Transcript_7452/g.11773 Transcript_7452/m.11773 type:complete len:88 (-) Transcript_7452:1344-1607(-)
MPLLDSEEELPKIAASPDNIRCMKLETPAICKTSLSKNPGKCPSVAAAEASGRGRIFALETDASDSSLVHSNDGEEKEEEEEEEDCF